MKRKLATATNPILNNLVYLVNKFGLIGRNDRPAIRGGLGQKIGPGILNQTGPLNSITHLFSLFGLSNVYTNQAFS